MTETRMQLDDWLDDLCVRFIINLPREELESVERICFQVEEAQWFYEDFIRPLDPSLPSMSLRQFCLLIFQHCPLLARFSEHHHTTAFDEFLAYKTRVPVRGVIMLNDAMDEVLLVKGWKKGAGWSFPRGKINKDEKDLDCAIREAYEETGFNLMSAGLVHDELEMKYIEVTMREQQMKLYIFRGVPQDTVFQPRTRKEISKIQWYTLANLPGYHKNKGAQQATDDGEPSAAKFYMVAPFLVPLKKWIGQQQKQDANKKGIPSASSAINDEMLTNSDFVVGEHVAANERITAFPEPPLGNLSHTSAIDATAQLKRLLSVDASASGVSSPMTDATAHPASGDLLAMLKGAKVTNEITVPARNVMQTPLNQVDFETHEPRSPRHSHHRPPPFSSMPPPPVFPLSPFSTSLHRNGTAGGLQPIPSSILHKDTADESMTASHTTNEHLAVHPVSDVLQPTAVDGFPLQDARPYQQVGDSQLTRSLQVNDTPAASVPSPSRLPLPKLSSHAQNLLNVFKSTGGPPSNNTVSPAFLNVPVRDPIVNSRAHVTKTELTEAGPTTTNHATQLGLMQQTQQAAPQLIANGVHQVLPVSIDSDISLVAPKAKVAGAHQEALFKLFRTPSVAQQAQTNIKIPVVSLAPEPAELSAIRSPGIFPETKEFLDSKEVPRNQEIANSPSLKAAVIDPASATVTGPQNLPDFSSVRRKQRQAKEPKEERHDERRATPIQILKRPVEVQTQSLDRLTQPLRETASLQPNVKAPAGLTTTPVKPFQPQILRRSKPEATSEKQSPGYVAKKLWQTLPEQLTRNEAMFRDRSQIKDLGQSVVRVAEADDRQPTYRETFRQTSPGQVPGQREVVSVTKTIHDQQVASQSQAPSNLLVAGDPTNAIASSSPNMDYNPVPATTIYLPVAPKPDHVEPREPAGVDQKQKLLSLFGMPKSTAGQAVSSPSVPSPLGGRHAALPEDDSSNVQIPVPRVNSIAADDMSTGSVRLSRSRINSIASPPWEGTVKRHVGGGSQSPISPLDKGFLLSYLEGVVKSAGR